MCDYQKRDGSYCQTPGMFFVVIRGTEIVPALGSPALAAWSYHGLPFEDGARPNFVPSSRSLTACTAHLAATVRSIEEIRVAPRTHTYGEFVVSTRASNPTTVAPIYR